MAVRGFNALALQADPEMPWFSRTIALAPDVRALCGERSIAYGIWEASPEPGGDMVDEFDADFWIVEAEQPLDWLQITERFRAIHPYVPAAIVTLSLSDIEWLHAASFDCLGEAYVPDNPQATPIAQAYEAQRRGWTGTRFQPVVEVNVEYPLSSYSQALSGFPSFWVWNAESLLS